MKISNFKQTKITSMKITEKLSNLAPGEVAEVTKNEFENILKAEKQTEGPFGFIPKSFPEYADECLGDKYEDVPPIQEDEAITCIQYFVQKQGEYVGYRQSCPNGARLYRLTVKATFPNAKPIYCRKEGNTLFSCVIVY